MANVVGERFQITIDKAVREHLGIRPGDQAIERVEGRQMVVYFMPRPHRRSLRGALKTPDVVAHDADVAAENERAWAARGAEITAALRRDGERRAADE